MTRGFPKPNIPLLSVKRILYYIMLYIVYIIKVDKVIIFCLNLYICIYMYDESILCYNTLIHTPKENDENVDMNKKMLCCYCNIGVFYKRPLYDMVCLYIDMKYEH